MLGEKGMGVSKKAERHRGVLELGLGPRGGGAGGVGRT